MVSMFAVGSEVAVGERVFTPPPPRRFRLRAPLAQESSSGARRRRRYHTRDHIARLRTSPAQPSRPQSGPGRRTGRPQRSVRRVQRIFVIKLEFQPKRKKHRHLGLTFLHTKVFWLFQKKNHKIVKYSFFL